MSTAMQVNFTGNHKHADFSTSFNLRMNSDPTVNQTQSSRGTARVRFRCMNQNFDPESS